jgi:transcriptional regulator with XRE-family HTH domain
MSDRLHQLKLRAARWRAVDARGARTIVEAADALGLSPRHVGRLEAGTCSPRARTRRRYLHTFGIDPWAEAEALSTAPDPPAQRIERGRVLREKRQELGLTLEEVAALVRETAPKKRTQHWTGRQFMASSYRVSRSTVSAYELGARCGEYGCAYGVCKVLGLDVAELFPEVRPFAPGAPAGAPPDTRREIEILWP